MNFLLLAAAAAQVANPLGNTIKLECSGTEKTVERVGSSETILAETATAMHFYIDLKEARWCRNSCKFTMEIQKILPRTIVLREPDEEGHGNQWISRDTGQSFFAYPFTDQGSGKRLHSVSDMMCRASSAPANIMPAPDPVKF